MKVLYVASEALPFMAWEMLQAHCLWLFAKDLSAVVL